MLDASALITKSQIKHIHTLLTNRGIEDALYRELSEDEIALMNDIKELGEVLEKLVSRLRATEDIDQRWASIGATDLQTGLMALTRAVARPESF